jgi:hypothetical protein
VYIAVETMRRVLLDFFSTTVALALLPYKAGCHN